MKLTDRTILITGGTSGIGLEMARQLQARGNQVIVTGRDQARLAAAATAIPGVAVRESDVSDPAAIEALAERVLTDFPALDVLVNNAGVMRNLDLRQPRPLDDISREIETNLAGPIRMVQQLLPHLASRPSALIVNVSSGLAFVPLPIAPVYSATKAALHSYSQSLRMQLAGSSVRIVELAPPAVETKLFRGEFEREMQGQKAMDPSRLVRRMIEGIEAGKTEIRPGIANLLKALSRVAPDLMLRQLARMSRAAPA